MINKTTPSQRNMTQNTINKGSLEAKRKKLSVDNMWSEMIYWTFRNI